MERYESFCTEDHGPERTTRERNAGPVIISRKIENEKQEKKTESRLRSDDDEDINSDENDDDDADMSNDIEIYRVVYRLLS